ncbi:MAG: hypothetical protein AB1611_05730 [bacterium]
MNFESIENTCEYAEKLVETYFAADWQSLSASRRLFLPGSVCNAMQFLPGKPQTLVVGPQPSPGLLYLIKNLNPVIF